MKFDNTEIVYHKSRPFWNTAIQDKWCTIVLESPVKLSYEMRKKMLCSMDIALDGHRFAGNGNNFNNFLWNVARIPEKAISKIPYKGKVISMSSSENEIKKVYGVDAETAKQYGEELRQLHQVASQEHRDLVSKWQEKFKRFPYATCGDTNVFLVDLFSSSYIGGPRAFFDFETGKIASCHNIGKFIGRVEAVRPELECFTNLYPDIPIYLTFIDYTESSEAKSVLTLYIFNKEIKAVTTRTLKQLRYILFKDTGLLSDMLFNIKYKIRNFIWNIEDALTKKENRSNDKKRAARDWQFYECTGEQYFTPQEAAYYIIDYRNNIS